MNVFDELECLVEWTVNNEVLIPTALSVCFTYLEAVCVVTILCLWQLIMMFSDFLIFSVTFMCSTLCVLGKLIGLCCRLLVRQAVSEMILWYF